MKKILVVGGVAGGASTVTRLRRLDENAEIIMFERGEYISFANCGLPYHIGDVIKDRGKLLVTTPEKMKKRFNIDVRINSDVTLVDTENKKIKVNSKEKGIYEESYDYLVLSPGAKALVPKIEGIDSNKIFTLRNIHDMDKIKKYVYKNNVKNASVIGGGYVGVEMAENLKEIGVKVTLIEAAPHILAPFDSDMVTIAEKEMEENNISLKLEDGVKSFNEVSEGVEVILNSGSKVTSDIVILSIGVMPDTAFLKDSGIELGKRGHIIVNEKMQTSKEGVFAAGDAVEVVDFVNGSKTAIPLAGPANKQGRIVADNICGIKTSYKGTLGTSVIKVFDLTCANTGNNERTLQRLNIPYKVIYVHPQSHASYYPGATPIDIKLIFNDEGKILGAQAIGYEGVEKRIDAIATVIRLKGTVTDLTELELSYAPPFSSAKDPVNMAGYVAENVLMGKSEVVLPREVDNRDKENIVLLDVRTKLERQSGYIKDSINIELNNLRNKIKELDKNKEYWVYCNVGLTAYIAERILKSNGFKVKNVTGGYKSYSGQKFKPKDINFKEGKKKQNNVVKSEMKSIDVDACGLSCPGPLMKVKNTMDNLKEGEVLNIKASDPGFLVDIKSWCKRTNNNLLNVEKEKGIITASIQKGMAQKNNIEDNAKVIESKENKTIVVFSGDLDKALASFIIANGAATMGKKVTMFFTFWGLNILRKSEKVKSQKNLVEKMFGFMMPRGSKKLKLSKMNMMGMGTKMMRKVMKDKNIESLEDLIKSGMESGIEIVACSMSMDVMGIRKEELIDGVKIGGVGYYLGETEDSSLNLFI